MNLLNKIKDLSLDEIINLLILEEITLTEFNREFCENYPTLWLNIVFGFQSWENFEKHIKAWIICNSALEDGRSLSFTEVFTSLK